MKRIPAKRTGAILMIGGAAGFIAMQIVIFSILFNVYGCAGRTFSDPNAAGCSVGRLEMYRLINAACATVAILSLVVLITGIVIHNLRRKQ